MDFMFSDPTMLDDLDFLYKSDTARKLMFYYQVCIEISETQNEDTKITSLYYLGGRNKSWGGWEVETTKAEQDQ